MATKQSFVNVNVYLKKKLYYIIVTAKYINSHNVCALYKVSTGILIITSINQSKLLSF